MSAFGDLNYPADFPHFNYVNTNAPKGGIYSEIVATRGYNGSFLTFTSLNGYILKGEGAMGMDLTFATLMVRSGDEPDAMYGLAARSVRITDNGLTYRFTLRPEAKFHDGTPLTAHDVAWSINTLKENGHPIITQQLRDCKGAEATDDRTVVVRFAEGRARDVPLFRRRSSDFLPSLLFQATVRSVDAGNPAWQWPVQGRALSDRAFTSNSIGSRIGGAPTCRSPAG